MGSLEDFIERIKSHPMLWDVNSLAYRDLIRKEMIWESVAAESGMASGKEAKLQWKRLRDSHREALRRRKSSTADSSLHNRPWKYEKSMEFLLSLTNTTATPKYLNTETIDFITPEDIGIEVDQAHNSPPHEFDRNDEPPRKRPATEESRLANNANQQDPLTSLFLSMCEKTKVLPRHLQLRVQKEVFDAVTRAEEEALLNDPINYDYESPTSSSSILQPGFTREVFIKRSNSPSDLSSE